MTSLLRDHPVRNFVISQDQSLEQSRTLMFHTSFNLQAIITRQGCLMSEGAVYQFNCPEGHLGGKPEMDTDTEFIRCYVFTEDNFHNK